MEQSVKRFNVKLQTYAALLISFYLLTFSTLLFATPPINMCRNETVTYSVGEIVKQSFKDNMSDDMFKTVQVTVLPLWNDNPEKTTSKVECPAIFTLLIGKNNSMQKRLFSYSVTPLNQNDDREFEIKVSFPKK